MNSYAFNTKENKSQAVAQRQSAVRPTFQFMDNRPEAMAQRKLQETINNSSIITSNKSSIQKKANQTGLPDNLKSGMENLSGHSLDDVKVHYNSNKPTQLQALAYAQGTDIHLAAGQEKHLPHEAWHVVQQKQGRVRPTIQTKGVNINDNVGLEKEADVMGGKSLQLKSNTVTQKKSDAHSGGCGCASCNMQTTQLKAVEEASVVTQLTCDKGHKNHASGACPVPKAKQGAFNTKRAGQSHPQHGGDAKGRAKMYGKRKG